MSDPTGNAYVGESREPQPALWPRMFGGWWGKKGGKPGSTTRRGWSWEPRDKVFPDGGSSQLCQRVTTGFGKNEVSGNLDKEQFCGMMGMETQLERE